MCFRSVGRLDDKVQLGNQRENVARARAAGVAAGPQLSRREAVVYGAELAHCGQREPCAFGQLAASVYSGKHKDDEPKLCIDGRL